MQIDYIIKGQGICGTILSYLLIKAGKTVVVIDKEASNSSSRVASGLINPVTGKRIVTSWMIEELMPIATDIYSSFEKELNIKTLEKTPLLDFHVSGDQNAIFGKRAAEENKYLQAVEYTGEQEAYFRFNYGIGKIDPCWLVNLPGMLSTWQQYLAKQDALLNEQYDHSLLQLTEAGVIYGGINAKGIIYCGGVDDFNDPFFSALPWSRNKGEALIASIPDLPRNFIYKQGIKIVPFKENLFWIGASFDWNYDDTEPTTAFRNKAEQQLRYWLRLPYTITDHWAAERPSTVDYKPFVGEHPLYPGVYMLNGMGTKGCSQAPYFAIQLAEHLLKGAPILPEVALERFRNVLSRDKK